MIELRSNFLRAKFIHLILSLSLISAIVPAARAQQFDPNLYGEMRWRMIGPFRGGRTVAATGVPGQPNVFYIASVNGGVWKSTDSGRVWKPIFDGQPTGSIGAIAVAASNPNVIYVGSGEGLQRPDLSTGDGIYKSTDGGQTWKHLGLSNGQQISRIAVDPHDPDRVLVAVLGHPYGPNEERGVFRSTDGGTNWQKVLYKDENTGAIDLAFDPWNSQTIYAALWVARRPPWTTGGTINGPGSGLYKSIDGGDTWKKLEGGLPASTEGLGRIGIGIAPSDPKRIYAFVYLPRQSGLFRSSDAGEKWERVNSEERICGRGDDFSGVQVDPQDKDTIYVANTSTYKSTDAGRNFTAIKGAPGGDDYHTIWINPENSRIILLGSDQGATITVNGGDTWSSWYNQPTAQFYHVITDNRFPYWVYGGQQESGSAAVASRGNDGEITFREFHPVGVEEYGYVAPDPLNSNIVYGGKVTRFDWTTGQTQDVSPAVERSGKYRFNRTAPLIFSPADPHILFLGSNVLFETSDGGHSWKIASPDLTREDPGVPPNLGMFSTSDEAKRKHRGVIYSIGPSFKNANVIWAGTDDGLIQVTRDGGKTWKNVTPPELTPWSKVAQIEASHSDITTAYAAVNRLRLDDLHPYIYRTTDGGKTWQLISKGLPDNAPVNTVREDPERRGLLFAGTENSVYVSFNDGDDWQPLQLNLPHTSMRDLTIHGDDLIVGTHGRSFWILDDITPLRQMSEEVAKGQAHLFRPQVTYRVQRDTNTDTPLPPEEPAGKNPPHGAVLDYYLKQESTAPVTLEILSHTGALVRRFSSGDKPESLDERNMNVPTYWAEPSHVISTETGMHRFVWDLRYAPPDSARREYPISAIYHDTPRGPLGPTAPPGQYFVALTVGAQKFTQPLVLKMDPRVKTSAAGLARKFDLEMKVMDSMKKVEADRQQVRALRAKLRNVMQEFMKGTAADAKFDPRIEQTRRAIAEFDEKAAGFEGTEGGRRFSAEGSNPQSFSRLIQDMTGILDKVDGADAEPTMQLEDAFGELRGEFQKLNASWADFEKHDLAALNQKLKEAKLNAITP
ncbi:MAG TPA: glycoside hydrolase [Terriglobia bacterium]|nr:glycoside hydrolase [Terriglobia bacterium]